MNEYLRGTEHENEEMYGVEEDEEGSIRDYQDIEEIEDDTFMISGKAAIIHEQPSETIKQNINSRSSLMGIKE